MSFYVYRPVERVFLAEDEKNWTEDMFSAASFASRQLGDDIAVPELGEGHDAYVLDDGLEAYEAALDAAIDAARGEHDGRA